LIEMLPGVANASETSEGRIYILRRCFSLVRSKRQTWRLF
jgi:hypothetical protein